MNKNTLTDLQIQKPSKLGTCTVWVKIKQGGAGFENVEQSKITVLPKSTALQLEKFTESFVFSGLTEKEIKWKST